MAGTVIFLTVTGAGNWTVPSDWNSAQNTVEVIGGGSGGNTLGGAGAGGAYAKVTNLALTAGASIAYSVGIGGAPTVAGGNTFFNGTAGAGNNSAQANGGAAPVTTTGGIGGAVVNGSGFTGGNGGSLSTDAGGGGGAAGLNGAGVNGANGGVGAGGNGGNGDNNSGGAGSAGGTTGIIANGGPGTEYDASHGSGGGGGGCTTGTAGNGGLYGAGGGGALAGGTAGSGAQGFIVITYNPLVYFQQWVDPRSYDLRKANAWAVTLAVASGLTFVDPIPSIQAANTVSNGPIFSKTIIYQSRTQPTFTPPPETITVDKWYARFTDPVRIKSGLPSQEQSFLAYNTLTFTPSVSGWFQGFTNPPKPKVGLGTNLQQSLAWSGFTPAAETITVDKWFAQLSKHPGSRAALLTALQQQPAFSPLPFTPQISDGLSSDGPLFSQAFLYQRSAAPVTTPPAEVITVDKWFAALSKHPGAKPGLSVALQQQPALNPLPFTVLIAGGYPLDGPTFQQALLYQGTAAPVTTPPTETITVDKWFAQLSVRLYPRPGLIAALQHSLEFTAPLPDIKASGLLSDGPGFPKRLIYQELGLAPFTPVAEVVTADKWYIAWQNPLRRLGGLPAASQQAFTGSQFPFTVSTNGWLRSFSEPIRVRAALAVQQQPVLALNPLPFTPSVAGWVTGLSEPKRYRSWLVTAEQPFYTTVYAPTPTPSVSGWVAQLSTPPNPRLGLSARFQQALAWNANPNPQTVITITLGSTEAGDTFLGLLAESANPASARVSIHEFGKRSGYTSVIEHQQRSGFTSIAENAGQGAFTSIVTSTSS